MPLFSPPRYQAPFQPLRRPPWSERVLAAVERGVKGPLFGCRMCGNCILQETAFACPMTCPKGLRNGLCGGATPEACEVDPSRPCTWYVIYARAERLGRLDTLLEINAPLDGNQVGRETWLSALRLWRQRGQGPHPRDLLTNRAKFNAEWVAFFRALRQPDWWQGDSVYHPPTPGSPLGAPVSNLAARLAAGEFVVTAEIAPPLGAAPGLIAKKVAGCKDAIVAANFTDNASASPRMSSLAASKICLDAGLEPVMQLQARDRSRIAIEADAIGAAALGIHNILCLSGDHHRFGPSPLSKPDQFDLDAVQMLWMLRRLRDEGKYLDGRTVKEPPLYFLGTAASPFGAPPKYEAIRMEKKVNAGAQFVQTQPIFDVAQFTTWLEALDKRGLLDKVAILAGVAPLRSARAGHYMQDEVPDVVIPPAILKRMDAAGEKDGQQEEGVAIALEMIEQLKPLAGIRGLHIMAVHGGEDVVPRLVREGGLGCPDLA